MRAGRYAQLGPVEVKYGVAALTRSALTLIANLRPDPFRQPEREAG
jgi:hypothetical protein